MFITVLSNLNCHWNLSCASWMWWTECRIFRVKKKRFIMQT